MKNKVILIGLAFIFGSLTTLSGCNNQVASSISEILLKSISVDTMPSKVSYIEGDTLDLTGLKVLATYTDDTTKNVIDYTVDKTGPLTINDTTVVISYTEKNITKTCNFNISINYREPIVIPVKGEQRYDFDVIAGYGKVENSKVTSKEGIGSYITDFTWKNKSKATFNIYSDVEAECDMVIKVRKTMDIITLTSQVSVTINGEALESIAEVGGSKEGQEAEFSEVNLGQFYLNKGDNVIEITPQSSISNFDFMSIIFYTSKEANLRWTALKDVTGKIFYGIDDHVEIDGDYKKSLEENCIGCKGYNTSSANFPIYSARNANAKIYMIQSGMPTINVLTSYYTFTINGVRQYSNAMTNYTNTQWGDYKIIEIGNYRLDSGKNNIKFEVGPVDWSNSFNIRGIVIETDVDVSYDEVTLLPHACLDKCDVCGGCKNEECQEENCLTKCTCVKEKEYIFLGSDERVDISSSLIKSRGVIEVADYSAENVITYNLNSEKEAKANLSFDVSGNPVAQWTFTDYFKVFVNNVQLSKEEYTAKTIQTSYQNFSNIELGEIDLLKGENKIEIKYSCASNEIYRFDFKSMTIKSKYNVEFTSPKVENNLTKYTFNAIDEQVVINDNLTKNTENNCVEVSADYGVENKIAFNLTSSKQTKANIEFTTSSNPIAQWTFVDYFRVWYNVDGELTSDNKLSKTDYKAHTQQGDYSNYVTINLGEFELLEGDNTITIGFACAGNADYRFSVRDLIITTDAVVSYR